MYRLALLLIFCAVVRAEEIPLSLSRLDLRHVRAETVTYRDLPALKLTGDSADTGETMAIIKGLVFRDGTINLDVAGTPSQTAEAQARGFIGVAFRASGGAARFENIYIRPTNGRADDQLRRNHSVQYESVPDFPWFRLRKESPGVYETYTDLAAGEWTHLRLEVHGTSVELYVNRAAQPCLIVHDLKLGDSAGGIGLWIGPGTEGYFRELTVTPKP